ncbi:MAG: flagellar biosynthetic protein FliR, partial [Rhizobiales bacterium]|nr:flagellar biosynthetic protein FliR [Hyphomicrobiales bacterium]
MRVDISFLPAIGAAFILMFARIGTMVMLLPGLGETSVPVRLRLVAALALTAVLFPLHRGDFAIDLGALGPLVLMLVKEMIVGAVLGISVRLALSALQVAGSIVAQQLGLGFVTAIDPTQGQQGALVGKLLVLLSMTLICATDLHHLMIAALYDSYRLFRPGE